MADHPRSRAKSAREEAPADEPLGNIITFYSYKGGTGRSMALANVAWILASNGKRVLTVDWDLEAPGLHRYYTPFLTDKDLTGSEGLIDLLIEFRDATAIGGAGADDDKWHEAYADISSYVISLDWDFPRGGTLDILPAGRQGASYSARVNSFDWVEFYERRGGGVFLESIKEKMRADYDYVLIDSRTGVSDTSGICTVQMPDAVVVCFTLNNQGIQGSAAVSHSIYDQRLRKGRDIAIFPVPMRVEPFEKIKMDTRRDYAKRMFEVFPAHLSPQLRAQFQEDTQVKYLPYYAYEEILATFGNRPGESESTSLLAPAERLTAYLTDYLNGETVSRMEASEHLESRRQSILALFEGKQVMADPSQLLVLSADAAWAGLKPDDERVARRALLRLVRVADAYEQGGDTLLLVRLTEFDEVTQTVLNNLGATPLLTIDRDPSSGEAAVQISSRELLRNWPRLQSWIQDDREFLLWRQKLDIAIAEWKRLNEDNGALLGGAPLEVAKRWQSGRAEDLNETEIVYINRCIAEEERRRREHIEREEREKLITAERTEFQQQAEDLIKNNQKSQRRGRLRTAIVGAVILLALTAVALWIYQKKIARDTAENLTAEGNEMVKDNVDGAIEKYNQAIGIDPSYSLAYSSRGRAYFGKDRFDEALADFNEAIRLDANNASAYVGRGDVYWQKRDLPNAADAYDQAIKIAPKLSEAYTKRGKVLAAQEKPDKAVDDYDQAIKISPNNPDALLWRGAARSKLRDYDKAFNDFNKALEMNPNLTEAHIKRAEAFEARDNPGDTEQAITEFTQAIKQTPYDPKLYLHRADAYKVSKRREQAIADYEKARDYSERGQKNDEVNKTAKERLQEFKPKQAIEATTPNPANPKIYLHYRDTKDVTTLNRIAAALRKHPNYTVADTFTQVTQFTAGDVRYFYTEDESNAQAIKQIVENTLKSARIEQPLELKLFKNLSNRVSQGLIEVWLPSLPAPSLNIQSPLMNSPYQQRRRPQAQ
jgi:tetratricopeptide (TPR) repeat protein